MEISNPENEVLPDNVVPIRDEPMFVFPDTLEVPDEGAPFSIEIGMRTGGETIVTHKIIGFETKMDGMERLREVGQIWKEQAGLSGRLFNRLGLEVARLNIHGDTHEVVDLESPEA